jgi:hypothetical protein
MGEAYQRSCSNRKGFGQTVASARRACHGFHPVNPVHPVGLSAVSICEFCGFSGYSAHAALTGERTFPKGAFGLDLN